jgi:hypothetical protein
LANNKRESQSPSDFMVYLNADKERLMRQRESLLDSRQSVIQQAQEAVKRAEAQLLQVAAASQTAIQMTEVDLNRVLAQLGEDPIQLTFQVNTVNSE